MVSGISGSGAFSPTSYSRTSTPDPVKMLEKVFTKIDANGDDRIDKDELSAFLEQASSTSGVNSSSDLDELFSVMDADGNGSITQQEASNAIGDILKQLQGQMMNARIGGMGGMPPPPPMGPPPDTAESDEEMFSSIDTNGDGYIDQTEISTMLESLSQNQDTISDGPDVADLLSRDDTDGDGQISQDEFTTAIHQRRGEMESGLNSGGFSERTAGDSDSMTSAFIASILQRYQTITQTSANQAAIYQVDIAA